MEIRDFLAQILDEEIIFGEKYSFRIELDNENNSYIGFSVDIDKYSKSAPKTIGARIFRHTNNINNLEEMWCFQLGGICNSYSKNKQMPLRFETYGKIWEESEEEAQQYLKRVKKMVQNKTKEYKKIEETNKKKEIEELSARLKELGV